MLRDRLLKPGKDLKTKKLGAVPPNETWHIPHAAFLYAEKYGPNKGWEFGEAVFTRRFDLDGKGSKNVMTEEVVEEIANSLGLNGKEAATAQLEEAGDLRQALHFFLERGDLRCYSAFIR